MHRVAAKISTRRFIAAIVFHDDKVVAAETAPILRFMRSWTYDRVVAYCQKWQWGFEIPLPEGPRSGDGPESPSGQVVTDKQQPAVS
jgi:hypothetical protein